MCLSTDADDAWEHLTTASAAEEILESRDVVVRGEEFGFGGLEEKLQVCDLENEE